MQLLTGVRDREGMAGLQRTRSKEKVLSGQRTLWALAQALSSGITRPLARFTGTLPADPDSC